MKKSRTEIWALDKSTKLPVIVFRVVHDYLRLVAIYWKDYAVHCTIVLYKRQLIQFQPYRHTCLRTHASQTNVYLNYFSRHKQSLAQEK
jgi:hypothetical protein